MRRVGSYRYEYVPGGPTPQFYFTDVEVLASVYAAWSSVYADLDRVFPDSAYSTPILDQYRFDCDPTFGCSQYLLVNDNALDVDFNQVRRDTQREFARRRPALSARTGLRIAPKPTSTGSSS